MCDLFFTFTFLSDIDIQCLSEVMFFHPVVLDDGPVNIISLVPFQYFSRTDYIIYAFPGRASMTFPCLKMR